MSDHDRQTDIDAVGTQSATPAQNEAPAQNDALEIGVCLGVDGRYRIEEVLGHGGFGKAYLARDLRLDRLCVVKQLIVSRSWDAESRRIATDNFDREARLLVSLNSPGHPHIPEIYDYLDDKRCLVMKYIKGRDLDALLVERGAALPEDEALAYARAVCAALLYMHSRRPEPVLHRDLKPSNVLYDVEGRIWVIDFGLAKALPNELSLSNAQRSGSIGTRGYTPPEQWQGAAEPRSDVYALAATLYTLLTAQRPLADVSDMLLVLHQSNPTLRPAVAQLIQRAMTPDPTHRPTAQEMLADLDALIEAARVPPPPEPASVPSVEAVVGREKELRDLADHLARDRTVVITGMAGMGKSTVAAQLAHLRSTEPVFWHTCHEHEGAASVVRRLIEFLAWHGHAAAWRQFQRIQDTEDAPPDPLQLLDYVLPLIRSRPFTLCLDDTHHLAHDPTFPGLIARLLRALDAGASTLIATARSLPESVPPAINFVLDGLNELDMRALLAGRGAALTDNVLHSSLHQKTGGNAQLLLLAIDALRSIPDPKRLIGDLLQSANIERFLNSKVDRSLNDSERAIMGVLAVLGGYGGQEEMIEALLDGKAVRRELIALRERHLLIGGATAVGREYALHPIVREFYYQLLSTQQRQAMHRRAGDYYLAIGKDSLRAALHFVEGGDYQQAVLPATTDVRTQINLGRARELSALLERFAVEQVDAEQWLDLCITKGTVYTLLRHSTAARANYQAALTLLDARPDGPETRAIRIKIYQGMGELLESEAPQEALVWLQRGLALVVDDGAAVDEARLRLRIGSVLLAISRHHEARKELERSLQLLPDGLNTIRANILTNLGVVAWQQGDRERGMAAFREALHLHEEAGNLWNALDLRQNMRIHQDSNGEWDSAEADYQQALELAQRIGHVAREADLALNLGFVQMNRGNWEAAFESLTSSLNLARKHALHETLVYTLTTLADLYIRRADWKAAEDVLQEAEPRALELEIKQQLPEIYCGWALVKLARGEKAAALHNARYAVALAREIQYTAAEGIGLRVEARILLAHDDTAAAYEAMEASILLLRDEPYEAARTKALLAQAINNDDPERGRALLNDALQTFRALGAQQDLRELEAYSSQQ